MNKVEEGKSEEDCYHEKDINDLFEDIKKKINQLCENEIKQHRKEKEDETKSIAIPCNYILGFIIVTLYHLTTINNGRRSSGFDRFSLTNSVGAMGIQFHANKNKESCLELTVLKKNFKDAKEKEKEIKRCKDILLTSAKRFRTMYDKYVVDRSWRRIENPIEYPADDFWVAFKCDEDAIVETEDLRIDISRIMNAIAQYLAMEESIVVQTKQTSLFYYTKRFELYKKLHRCGMKNSSFYFMTIKTIKNSIAEKKEWTN